MTSLQKYLKGVVKETQHSKGRFTRVSSLLIVCYRCYIIFFSHSHTEQNLSFSTIYTLPVAVKSSP